VVAGWPTSVETTCGDANQSAAGEEMTAGPDSSGPFLDLAFSRYFNGFLGRHAFGHRGPTMSCVMLIGVRGTHFFIGSSGWRSVRIISGRADRRRGIIRVRRRCSPGRRRVVGHMGRIRKPRSWRGRELHGVWVVLLGRTGRRRRWCVRRRIIKLFIWVKAAIVVSIVMIY
jgi:hypothetical protein